jgi:ABC-2 type transport system permease protein
MRHDASRAHTLHALWWRLWRSGRNTVVQYVLKQPLRGGAVAIVVLAVWLMLGALFLGMLLFLGQANYQGLKPRLVESLLSLFFFTLFFLVTISSAVLIWGALFRSRSAHYHAQLPLSERDLYWSCSIEGGIWSSWAVLVLAVPLAGALVADRLFPSGIIERFSLLHALAITFTSVTAIVAFIMCCVGAGAWGSLILARIIPLLRRGIKGIIAVVALGLMFAAVMILGSLEQRGEPVAFMSEVIGKLRFAENPYLPPWWAQQAISAGLEGNIATWSYFIALLLTTASACALAGEFMAHKRLRRELDLLTGRPESRRRSTSKAWRLLPFLPRDLALLAAKDLRLFLREPAQVLQFTMFFGLLAFYLLLLPRVRQAFLFDDWWRPVVSLLNLTAVAMALATFTGRFVYPLLSLEGRRLWVLSLAPWPATRVVTAKFTFALVVGLPVSTALVILSGHMLSLTWAIIAYQVMIITALAIGLSAGALGLGARLADYQEDNPAKLVAGYGGTINLMASLAFSGLLLGGAVFPLLPDAMLLGPWRWLAGILWTVVVTYIWSMIFMRMAWRWFAQRG